MKKGDIILVSFPFSDLSGNKTRPALVLIEAELDVTVAFITTQIKWKEQTDILLQPDSENGLKKESIIRLSKITTIDKGLSLGLLGQLDHKTIELLNASLIAILKLDEKINLTFD